MLGMEVIWCLHGIHGQNMEDINQRLTNLDQDHTKKMGPNLPLIFQTKLAQCVVENWTKKATLFI
jgi:hypothetical protein